MSELEGRRILVVDDEPFMRMTIKAVLRVIDQFVIAEADNGVVAFGLVAEFKPDVVLGDVAMPHMAGIRRAVARASQAGAARHAGYNAYREIPGGDGDRCCAAAGQRLPDQAGLAEVARC